MCDLLAGPPPHGAEPAALCEKDVVVVERLRSVVDKSVVFTWFGTSAAQAVSHVAGEWSRWVGGLTPRVTAGRACSAGN
jgi:hypothetical protein